MSRELKAFEALSATSYFPEPSIIGVVKTFYESVSPALPDDLVSTPVADSPLPEDAQVLHFNYDEGHAGRFSVPGTEGGSIDIDYVLSQSHADPPEFIMSNLAFYDDVSASIGFTDDTELVIFSPGLNTVHQPAPEELPSTVRMQHYVKVLGPYPMAQIHTGSSRDQDDIEVEVSPLLQALISLLPEAARPEEVEDRILRFSSHIIDAMQVSLSLFNFWDTPLKDSFIKLFETTKDPSAAPFTLVVYSRASVECDAALRQHYKDSEDEESEEEIEARLRERVTILTVGSASRFFSDGPAYIHLAAWNDTLTSTIGVSAENGVSGAGKDAVFLNCDTPYNPEAFDNHNFSSSTSQYLSLVLHASKASGFRDLWEKAQSDEMVIPENVNELTNAMITMTNGTAYLWGPEDAWKNINSEEVLPDRETAINVLRDGMGEEFVERVVANFGE